MRLSCDQSSERSDQADPIRRRMLLGAVGVTALLEMFGVKGLVSEVFAKERKVGQQKEAVENLTDEQRVAETEESFLRFKEKILAHLDDFVKDPEMKEKIQHVFELFGENRKNPWRKKPSENEVVYGEERKGWFSYEFFSDSRPYSMGFNGLYRSIKISKDFFDPEDLGCLVTMCHELIHLKQDDEYRKRIPFERYRAYWFGNGNLSVVPEDEAEAISVAVEILNVATNGALKRNVLKGEQVNIPVKYNNLRNFLIKMAKAYYTNDYNAFVALVGERYESVSGEEDFFTRELIPK